MTAHDSPAGLPHEQAIGRALSELADRIERMGPVARFDSVDVGLTLAGRRRAILRFAPSPSQPQSKRYVELRVFTESGLSTSSQWLESGSNAELVAYLRRPDVVAETATTARELMESLRRNRLA